MFTFLKPYSKQIVIALSLMFIELIVELWHPLLMKTIIDEGIVKEDLSAVLLWGGIMIAVSLIAFAAGITNSFFSAHVSQNFGYDIREKLFQRIQHFSFAAFSRFPASGLITRITSDVNQLQNVVFMGLRIMLRAPLMMGGALIMSLLIDVRLASVLLVIVPVSIVLLIWMMKKGFHLFHAVQSWLDATNRVVRENLIGIRLIKAFVRSKREVSRFTETNEQLMNRTIAALRLIETTIPMLLLLLNVSVLLILWFGNWQLQASQIEAGSIVAIVIYATRMTSLFMMLSHIVMTISRAKASAERIREVLEAEDPTAAPASSSSLPASPITSGEVVFDQVTFQYPGTAMPVLRNVTFTIPAGHTVAVMGATGSGKTTLVQLIPRLYEVKEGAIYIDGIDIRTLPVDTLRTAIAVVPQEVVLFSGTVAENIRWGHQEASMEDVIEAAKHAQIHDTIMNLADQYEAMVGQKGVNLSGGQKQRLSIARALVRKPKLLLLDDSTSALDLQTEARLLAALKAYDCTTLIVTQKVSTAMNADAVLLLDQGSVQAMASHEQLLESSELYRQIVISQYGRKGGGQA